MKFYDGGRKSDSLEIRVKALEGSVKKLIEAIIALGVAIQRDPKTGEIMQIYPPVPLSPDNPQND